MYKDGTDLILGLMKETIFTPLGHSGSCKIQDKSSTGTRSTKEATSGKWEEKYIKSLSENISADGFVYDGDKMGYPSLKELWLKATPVKLRYCNRGDEETKYYEGDYVITSLDLEGKAGDDQKWSVSFENSGAIVPKPIVAG